MSSVTFPTDLGGDGSTVSDDNNSTTGLDDGGHVYRFVPALIQVVAMAATAASKAAQAAISAASTALTRQQTEALKQDVVVLKSAAELAKTQTEASAAGIQAAIIAAGLADNPPIQINPSTINADLTIASGYNASSIGPLMIADGVTVTINDNANWTIL